MNALYKDIKFYRGIINIYIHTHAHAHRMPL